MCTRHSYNSIKLGAYFYTPISQITQVHVAYGQRKKPHFSSSGFPSSSSSSSICPSSSDDTASFTASFSSTDMATSYVQAVGLLETEEGRARGEKPNVHSAFGIRTLENTEVSDVHWCIFSFPHSRSQHSAPIVIKGVTRGYESSTPVLHAS